MKVHHSRAVYIVFPSDTVKTQIGSKSIFPQESNEGIIIKILLWANCQIFTCLMHNRFFLHQNIAVTRKKHIASERRGVCANIDVSYVLLS